MPRIDTIRVEIQTGGSGPDGPVQFQFNGHTLAFENGEGNTAPGGKYTGEFEVGSFAHSVVLVGPEQGEWAIDDLRVSYLLDGEDAYHLRFAPITLSDSQNLNIYRPRPRPTFEV